MERFIVYEILWTRCEYGGPSTGAPPTLHSTEEKAYTYKREHEVDRINSKWPPDDPFYYTASGPEPRSVSKEVYEAVMAEEARSGQVIVLKENG